ncbi:MAG: tyrosine-type recombinase/integrase [Desulfobulbaceae bacterium]|nr:tyrosine-type recombinase/integrase [Desulfobulbaceae bacterium]
MFSGMRRGEIFGLQVKDLDFYQFLIWLRDPKGGKDVSVPMSAPVRALLKKQLAWCKEKHPDSPYVFPAHHGRKRTDSSAVNRIKKKAKLPKSFRIFHGLRHHLGVTLANSGEYTLDMIGELLTHKSTAITRRYAQFLPETKRRAADRAADLLQNMVTGQKQSKVVNLTNR